MKDASRFICVTPNEKNRVITVDTELWVKQMKEADVVPVSKRITGKIYYINYKEGWGFIDSKDKPFTRIFFHWKGLSKNAPEFPKLKKGMRVEFDLVLAPDGEQWRAVKVELANDIPG